MKKNIYLNIIVFLFSGVCFSQINGNVTDEKGLALPGVNVIAAGANSASAVTDFDGNFSIETEPGTGLAFSMVGFVTVSQKAAIGMKVVMKEEENKLNEVVVIGYGTRKAGAITGSVSQIKAADVIKTPAQNAVQGIQGKAAGVNIVTNDEPGANPTIRIRGLGTITGQRDPLYFIDVI
jgi:hypothetical protein